LNFDMHPSVLGAPGVPTRRSRSLGSRAERTNQHLDQGVAIGAPSSSQVSIAASTKDVQARKPTRTAGWLGSSPIPSAKGGDAPPASALQRVRTSLNPTARVIRFAVARRVLADRVAKLRRPARQTLVRRQLGFRLDP